MAREAERLALFPAAVSARRDLQPLETQNLAAGGLDAQLLIEPLRVKITAEDAHGEILGFSEIGT